MDAQNTVEAVDVDESDDPRGAFLSDLGGLVNRYSLENKSNTPDFVLAEFLLHCLAAFEASSLRRESWFGVSLDVARDWDEKVMQAIGEASMCWTNIEGAGTFDSDKAKQIGADLLAYLRNQ